MEKGGIGGGFLLGKGGIEGGFLVEKGGIGGELRGAII